MREVSIIWYHLIISKLSCNGVILNLLFSVTRVLIGLIYTNVKTMNKVKINHILMASGVYTLKIRGNIMSEKTHYNYLWRYILDIYRWGCNNKVWSPSKDQQCKIWLNTFKISEFHTFSASLIIIQIVFNISRIYENKFLLVCIMRSSAETAHNSFFSEYEDFQIRF